LGRFEELLTKKLVLVTGKGGIGKTLMAASIAQQAAARDMKVCLVESSAQDQVSPLFGFGKVGHKLTEVSSNISVINLNPQDNFRDFVVLHLGFAKLFERVFTKPIVRSFIQMLPGIAELTLLGRLFYLCEEKQDFDLVIFDGFASGHFLSLLKTPDAVLNSGMVGPVLEETRRVREFIFDQNKVGIVLVTTPEELVISEALDFSGRFVEEVNGPLSHIAVNRCLSVEQPVVDEQAFAEQEQSVLGAAVSYVHSRVVSEQRNLDRLYDGARSVFQERGVMMPRIYLLPDLGAVEEPLTANFSHTWFSHAQEVNWI
jgi:anion-transporting  ArsA/GET3 family ATPase